MAYSLAAEGKFPFHKTFAKLNGAQVPANAIMLVGGIGAFYALSGQFNLLTDWRYFKLDILHTDISRCDQTQKRPSKCSENL